MKEFIFSSPEVTSIKIKDSEKLFPVRRVICVGRNYAAHAREMGKDPSKEPPFFFYKPTDSVVNEGHDIPYPPQTNNLHYEVELVVAIGKGGKDIETKTASEHIYGYAVGVDLTRRDLQLDARDKGRPWDWGKGFDKSAPCSPIVERSKVQEHQSLRIWLDVNGKRRQDANTSDMIWCVDEIISIISESIELKAGDIIFTGTPENVGAVVKGDKLTAGVDGVGVIEFMIN